ncbi:alpha/beta hydrolase [Actinoplanes sp. NPDC051633]|uniref:alpha/beta hydrolase n=1 Tax=Actinoplanes sp. NPDC051633 TaxID=3155670 RepID=UPI00342E47C1
MDLYLPDAATPPVVLFLHGGGWRVGSRRSAGPAYEGTTAFDRLASRGLAVASVDYRLSGEARWPAQLEDAQAAVRWLRDKFGGSPIAAWGDSAGGHLAAMLGLVDHVDAVVAWYAPTDLTALAADLGADPMAADSREAQLLGAPLPTVPELTAQASPITHVHPGAPPFLLLHGTADRLVPCVQSERFRDALSAAGVAVELETYEGADHMWQGSDTAADKALDRTADFLLQELS